MQLNSLVSQMLPYPMLCWKTLGRIHTTNMWKEVEQMVYG